MCTQRQVDGSDDTGASRGGGRRGNRIGEIPFTVGTMHSDAEALVLRALGGSIVHEELKGDFIKALQAAEKALERARRGDDLIGIADAMLTSGLVHLLQGKPQIALARFAQVEELASDDPLRQLRACIYANLAAYLRFNTFPGNGGASATEIVARWPEYIVQVGQLQKRIAALQGQVSDPAIHLEIAFANLFLSNVQAARAILSNTGHLSEERLEQAAAAALRAPFGFVVQAPTLGTGPTLVAYADLIAADLCRLAGKGEEAQLLLSRAEAEYRWAGDLAGAALCRMTRGDWAAASFSTPLAWNFALRDSGQPGSDLAWTLEVLEARWDRTIIESVNSVYQEAEALFADAGAPRGAAALRLRRGYLAHLLGDYAAAAVHSRAARDAFGASGDYREYWLACAHYALARVGGGQLPEDLGLAREIGRWGASEGSFSYALGLGILFSRAGRHWFTRSGNYERALAAYRLAHALHEALGTGTNRAQSLVDQAGIHRAVGDTPTALTFYTGALERYEHEIDSAPLIAEELRLRVILLATDIYFLQARAADTNGMARAAATLRTCLDGMPEGPADPIAALDASGAKLDALLAGGEQLSSGITSWAVIRHGRSAVEDATVRVPLYEALRSEKGRGQQAERLFETALEAARRTGEDQRYLLEAEVLLRRRRDGDAIGAFRRFLARGGASSGWRGIATGLLGRSGGAAGRAEVDIQEQRNNELAAIFFARAQAFPEAKEHLERLERLSGAEWWLQ
jgi:tetratricopeptide (TPR) repeat protein